MKAEISLLVLLVSPSCLVTSVPDLGRGGYSRYVQHLTELASSQWYRKLGLGLLPDHDFPPVQYLAMSPLCSPAGPLPQPHQPLRPPLMVFLKSASGSCRDTSPSRRRYWGGGTSSAPLIPSISHQRSSPTLQNAVETKALEEERMKKWMARPDRPVLGHTASKATMHWLHPQPHLWDFNQLMVNSCMDNLHGLHVSYM